MDLQLSLKTNWFVLTKAGIKTEDYREINEFWLKRLYQKYDKSLTQPILDNLIQGLYISEYNLKLKPFDYNVMTLGYPKSTDYSRILKLEHKGIEIRTGNPEWGAEPNKLYFVIKHGDFF